MKIAEIKARQILDSRGNPTIETDVILADGTMGRASVPSGASTGSKEAVENRDRNSEHYGGQTVLTAVRNVEEIIGPKMIRFDANDQKLIDEELAILGATDNFAKVGAEAVLSVSLASAKAGAISSGMPLYQYFASLSQTRTVLLPMPFLNLINGGTHAGFVTDFQEFMVIPIGARSFGEALEMGTEIYHALGLVLKQRGYETPVGDEGGYAVHFVKGNREALEILLEGISLAGFKQNHDVCLALDLAASEFFNGKKYKLKSEGVELDGDDLIGWLEKLVSEFPIVSLEDPLAETDIPSWKKITDRLGGKVTIVGDDLIVTNVKILRRTIEEKLCNGVIIKPNQVGTVTATLATLTEAKKKGFKTVVSHRSGETDDTSVAHLAVGTACGLVKFGAPARGERLAKYNELLRIEEELGSEAKFAKWPI